MLIQAYKPINPLLQEHIECYYFVSRSKNDPSFSYFTYPSVNNILSLTHGVIHKTSGNKVVIEKSSKSKFIAEFTKPFDTPLQIEYTSEISELTLYFKPCSAFNFIDPAYHDEFYTNETFLSYIPNLESVFKEILAEENETKKIEILENFFLNLFNEYPLPRVSKAIQLLEENPEIKIDKLAEELEISRKTLNQLFKKYIFRSPSNYRKVLRFRNSLSIKSDDLTSLAYTLGFFDQSHMIREFKGITGNTPKNFFSNVQSVENNSIKWMING